jgi:hypothetical protein
MVLHEVLLDRSSDGLLLGLDCDGCPPLASTLVKGPEEAQRNNGGMF